MFRRAIVALFALAVPVAAQAAEVMVVNGTGSAISSISIRPFGGSEWQPVDGSLSAGARRSISGKGETCAFDIRARVAGGAEVTWSGVNFCETKAVTLNRRADGTAWADYD